MVDIIDWLWIVLRAAGNPYMGIFLVSLVGNLVLFFPIPYLILVFSIAIESTEAELLTLAFIGAVGATIGKFVSYLIGYGGRMTLGEKYKNRFNSLRRILGGSAFFAAFIFAASPLPDDLVFIPLGMIEYNPVKTFLACLAGKFVITLVAVWSGRFSRSTISWFLGSESHYTIIISIVAIVVATIIMIKIDWEKLLLRDEPEVKTAGE